MTSASSMWTTRRDGSLFPPTTLLLAASGEVTIHMNGIVFAYFGPETMLPFTSIVATVVGIFMMFGRHSVRLVRRTILSRLIGNRKNKPVPKPHFHVEVETRAAAEVSPQ